LEDPITGKQTLQGQKVSSHTESDVVRDLSQLCIFIYFLLYIIHYYLHTESQLQKKIYNK